VSAVAQRADVPTVLAETTLVVGGARSGKSAFAEGLILESGLKPIYLATGAARDPEMAERIRRHRARRGSAWSTIEGERDLADALIRASAPGAAVLVDCLTMWLAELMEAGRDPDAEAGRLVAALPNLKAPAVFVSNEVGLGIVPENALARAFRDAQGRLNQAMAQAAARVVFIAAGLPIVLKDRTTP
jgi:adenosylcobinamide kinase/adenosylcobinamide-phosphate guanylyltransferase